VAVIAANADILLPTSSDNRQDAGATLFEARAISTNEPARSR